jgi:hypothetical protein
MNGGEAMSKTLWLVSGILMTASVALSGQVTIDEQLNGGADVGFYKSQDKKDGGGGTFDGNPDFGQIVPLTDKGQPVGTVNKGSASLYRQVLAFNLQGYTSGQIANATLKFTLLGGAGTPGKVQLWSAPKTALSKTVNQVKVLFNDADFTDTGITYTAGSQSVDVTSLVKNAATNGGVIYFRFQAANDTSLSTALENSNYIGLAGFGNDDTEKRPELRLDVTPEPVIVGLAEAFGLAVLMPGHHLQR